MNHALICKYYYSDEKIDFINNHPEIKKFELYFNAIRARDWYYNAMKYHAIHIIKNLIPTITLKEIGKIVDLDHATVIYYFKRYTPMTGHKEFISKYFERFVENKIYPLKPKNHIDVKKYGEFKPTTFEEARKCRKEPSKGKTYEKKKREYSSAKNPAEKY